MKFDGERFIPTEVKTEGNLSITHFQRYEFVSQLVENKIVLDAACGAGYGSAIMAKKAKEVYGIDISKDAIKYSNENYKRTNTNFSTASITKLPFEDNFFDVIVSFETIEHVDKEAQEKFLDEINRVLKKDGIVIMSSPNRPIYSDKLSRKNEHHIKEFKKDEFDKFFKRYFDYVEFFNQYIEIAYFIENPSVDNAKIKSKRDEQFAENIIAIASKSSLSIDKIKSSVYMDNSTKYLDQRARRRKIFKLIHIIAPPKSKRRKLLMKVYAQLIKKDN